MRRIHAENVLITIVVKVQECSPASHRLRQQFFSGGSVDVNKVDPGTVGLIRVRNQRDLQQWNLTQLRQTCRRVINTTGIRFGCGPEEVNEDSCERNSQHGNRILQREIDDFVVVDFSVGVVCHCKFCRPFSG